MEECDLNIWKHFDQFGITIPCSAIYFLEVGARVSLKVATKMSIRGKNLWKVRFFGSSSIAKTEECVEKVWNDLELFFLYLLF